MSTIAESEQWRPVVGLEHYEVSSEGRVRSIGRDVFNKGSGRRYWQAGKVLKSCDSGKAAKNGSMYQVVNLNRKVRFVHKLVAEAFLGPSNELDVNHKDGNKRNNQLCNLEYVSRSQNLMHASKHCLLSTLKPVAMVESDGFVSAVFPSINSASRMTKIQGQNISKACLGKRKQAGGFRWMYLHDACKHAQREALW
jgi:hypothetical protein